MLVVLKTPLHCLIVGVIEDSPSRHIQAISRVEFGIFSLNEADLELPGGESRTISQQRESRFASRTCQSSWLEILEQSHERACGLRFGF